MATPLKAVSCGGAALLGMVSLVDDLGPTLAEVVRVVQPGGIVVISDLFATQRMLRHPDASPNVFRTVDGLVDELRAATFAPTAEWRASADRPTRGTTPAGASTRRSSATTATPTCFERGRPTVSDSHG